VAFSQAQCQAVTDKINAGMSDLSAKIQQVKPAAQAGVDHWYIPGSVKDAVLWLADKLVNIAEWLWNKFVELMEGVAAPVMFFVDAFDWQDVKGLASNVAGDLNPAQLPSTQHWSGAAQQSYAKVVPLQVNATARIGTLADKTATALGLCAVTGLAFYVTLGVIIAQFIAAMAAAIAAFGTVAFSWAGVAIAVGDTSVSSGMVIAAVGALVALLGAQAQQMVSLHGEAVDNSVFPGGKWPNPNTSAYNHAS
jgi:hypothetical protein